LLLRSHGVAVEPTQIQHQFTKTATTGAVRAGAWYEHTLRRPVSKRNQWVPSDSTAVVLFESKLAESRWRTVRTASQMSNGMKPFLVGIITVVLMLVLYLPFDYFDFALSDAVRTIILVCAAGVAGFIADRISDRIVEWKTGPPADSGDS
jgi:hypothetical protein